MSATSTGGSSSPSARDHAAQLRPGTNCPRSVPWTSKFSLRRRITSCSRDSSPRTAAVVRGLGELRLQRRPHAREPAVEQGRGEAIERKPAAALFDDEAGFFQETQMARHTRLRDAEHRRQLGDVQPSVFSGKDAQ